MTEDDDIEPPALRELQPAAPAAPEVPNSPGFPDGSQVTMTITGPCESVWAAERRLLDQLRGWLIVRETTDGQRGTQEIMAVLTDQADRPFTAHKEYPAPADARDAALLDFLAAEYLTLEPFNMSDDDVGWRTIQHHQGKDSERTASEVYRDDPRQAIREAIARLERDPYCTGPLHIEDAAMAAPTPREQKP